MKIVSRICIMIDFDAVRVQQTPQVSLYVGRRNARSGLPSGSVEQMA